MSDILKDICASTLARVEGEERSVPLAEVKRQALSSKGGTYAFASALKGDNLAVIAEVKKASPSKGVIEISSITSPSPATMSRAVLRRSPA